jgi:glycosyltransferase involved in cell wall biosynthesis
VKILQVSASDGGGGAHKIASALHAGFRARGHTSAMAVGTRTSRDPDVHEIPFGISRSRELANRVAGRVVRRLSRRFPALRPLRRAMKAAHPLAYFRAYDAGREFFDYPGSRRILDLPGFVPDVVHLHNLHHAYFDLRSLPTLSARVPVALTLHDEWTYTGHCAYTMGIERWRDGCVSCPDLEIHPAIRRDATHENWLAKQAIYGRSRLYISAPSKWLLERARESILAGGAADFRLIPNGIDQQVFRPADQGSARDLLGLPSDRQILLFAANLLGRNPFKDYDTVAAAVEEVAVTLRDRQLLFVVLGGVGEVTMLENAELRFLPYETDPARVAAYYQAADIYLHAANADTFPTTVLEALSVGRPVVATAVGGIPEQVHSLAAAPGAWTGPAAERDTATGVLVAPHDAAGMAAATRALLTDEALRATLGRNAAMDASTRFGLDRQIDATLAWYAETIENWRGSRQEAA